MLATGGEEQVGPMPQRYLGRRRQAADSRRAAPRSTRAVGCGRRSSAGSADQALGLEIVEN
jgi:hypothetical protein